MGWAPFWAKFSQTHLVTLHVTDEEGKAWQDFNTKKVFRKTMNENNLI
jgi:hypothetical protein